ncbi:MAG: Crp/Fnr family transcriptional regulator [Limnochordia bacterium]
MGKEVGQPMECPHCDHSCVHRVPLFRGLSGEQLAQIQGVLTHRQVEAGEYIIWQGDMAHSLMVVNEGLVKLVRINEEGQELVVTLLYPGDYFGELSLFSETAFSVSAYAQGPTKLCILHKDQLQRLIEKNPTLAFLFLGELSRRLQEAQDLWEVAVTGRVEDRLARFLWEQFQLGPGEVLELPFSRRDIAGIIGTTPETVSRNIKKMVDGGLIQLLSPRKIRLLDGEKLRRAAKK